MTAYEKIVIITILLRKWSW